ncbi:Tim44-like domain-containing protein [Desulfobaculum senezii]
MNNVLKFLLVPLVVVAIVAISADFSDARRFGGGRSFGGSKSFNKGYSKPISPTQRSSRSGAAVNNSRSRFGGMGGMLGGLLAGSLLGSLFFGHPFAGGGFMDLLLLGGLAFLLLKLFRSRRRAATQYAGQGAGLSNGGAGPDFSARGDYAQSDAARRAQAGWGALGAQAQPQEESVSVPDGFNTDEFLEGAKVAFNRLQQSWDARDLNDIAQFATPAVMDEIRQQAEQDPNPSKTEILMLNARLLEVKPMDGKIVATVFFDAFMREDAASGSEQVREVWHFARNEHNESDMWRLDGIQQLDT